jgi:hypothetical protein
VLRLSQGHLTLLETCPRRFQHTVLDALAVPATPEQWLAQQWGDRFHLLMQQRELGLPIEPVLAEGWGTPGGGGGPDPRRIPPCLSPRKPFARVSTAAPCGFTAIGLRPSTICCGCGRTEGKLWIGKPIASPGPPDLLAKDWQTRLYCYLLVETTDLAPSR